MLPELLQLLVSKHGAGGVPVRSEVLVRVWSKSRELQVRIERVALYHFVYCYAYISYQGFTLSAEHSDHHCPRNCVLSDTAKAKFPDNS